MNKSKRQRQLDLLDKLLERLGTSTTNQYNPTDNVIWVQKLVAKLQNTEGDVKGLTKDEMLKANDIWQRHSYAKDY
jgi:hypothetical protein